MIANIVLKAIRQHTLLNGLSFALMVMPNRCCVDTLVCLPVAAVYHWPLQCSVVLDLIPILIQFQILFRLHPMAQIPVYQTLAYVRVPFESHMFHSEWCFFALGLHLL